MKHVSRANPFGLRRTAEAFATFLILGAVAGATGMNRRVGLTLFAAAYASVFIGGLWNIVWYALDTSARRARQWEAEGRCPKCGYDLTENQSGTCPECGHKIWT